MKFEQITVGPYEVNCSVIWGDAKQALIIDPGYDADLIESVLEENGLTVAAYLLTHAHADHISALTELHTAHPASIYLHQEDLDWAFSAMNQIPPHYPVPEKPVAPFIHPETSEAWTIADLNFHCLETPGHTRGGVCYWFQEDAICFTGDTLFKGSCGRTDLPGGDGRVLAQSLKKLAQLPLKTRIVAGHGENSTIEYELKTNFYMQQAGR